MSRLFQKYHNELAHATHYKEWYAAAFALDELEGKLEWRQEDESPDLTTN